MKISAAAAIIKCLENEGVRYAFGISGTHYLAFLKELKDSSIQYISVKHESSAGFMALNYAKIAQKPALVCATAGPGAANLINGIAELYKSCVPAFIMTPLVPTTSFGKNAFQEDTGLANSYSIKDIMAPVTRKAAVAHRAEIIPEYVRMLLRESLTPPYGPVYLGVPSDLFTEEIEFANLEPRAYRLTDDERVELSKIEKMAVALQEAKSPLLLLGTRCIYPNASKYIMEIVEALHVPFVLTHASKGLLDERHPLFGGVLDLFGHRSAEKLAKESDCIVAFGMDFGETETLKYDPELFAQARLFICDNHDKNLGVNYAGCLHIAGSIPAICTWLRRCIRDGVQEATPEKIVDIKQRILEMNAHQTADMEKDEQPLRIERILKCISDEIDSDNTIMLADIGASSFSTIRHFIAGKGSYYASPAGYSMGQSVSGCIGAKLADPQAHIICVTGDGAFCMQGSEVLTAVQYEIGITWVIFVEGLYNAININQCLAYGGDLQYCAELINPDYPKLAEAYGVDSFHVSTLDDLTSALTNARKANAECRCALITIEYEYPEHLPAKSRSIALIKDYGQTKDIKSNPYLMRAFKKVLRERV